MSNKRPTLIDKYRFYPWYLNLSLVLFYLFGSISSPLYTSVLQYKNIISDPFDWTVSPIEFVPEYLIISSDDRKKTYTDLDSSSFVRIPDYNIDVLSRSIDDYKAWDDIYEETLASRVIYTVPYMSTYNYDYNEFSWSHPWVDIKAPVWTPIRSIANWVVVQVWSQPTWFWNYVVIKHNNVNYNWELQTIYSNYAHMSEVYAKEGKKINKWAVIWTVGDTWMSFWSHLHFQIDLDTAPFHPYRPFTWNEAMEANVNFFEAINVWLWKENAIKYTLNPTQFVYDNIWFTLVKDTQVDNVVLSTSNDVIESIPTTDDLIEDNIELTSAPEEEKVIEDIDKIDNDIQVDLVKEEIIDEVNNVNTEEVKKIEIIDDLDLKETTKIEKIKIVDDIDVISLNDDLVLEDNVEIALLDDAINEELFALSNITIDNNDSLVNDELVSNDLAIEELVLDNEDTSDIATIEEDEDDDIFTSLTDSLSSISLDIEEEKLPLFSDVDVTHKYYEEIKYLKEKWVINWFSDNTFRSESNITRAEALKIFLLSFWKNKLDTTEQLFDDVMVRSWENWYIAQWIQMSLVSSDNNKFYPNRTINRVEWLKILLKITNVDLSIYENESISLSDTNIQDWFYKYIFYSVKNKLLSYKWDLFDPEKPLTRWELVYMINQMIEK